MGIRNHGAVSTIYFVSRSKQCNDCCKDGRVPEIIIVQISEERAPRNTLPMIAGIAEPSVWYLQKV